jgi:GntR family transcriptional regulator
VLSNAPADVRQVLDIAASAQVVELASLHVRNGQPTAIEISYLPASLVPGLEQADVAQSELYELLEDRYGLRVARAEETLDSILLEGASAQLLDVPVGSAGFQIERRSYLPSGRLVELRRRQMPGTRVRFQASRGRDDLFREEKALRPS